MRMLDVLTSAMLVLALIFLGHAKASNDPVKADPKSGENFNRYYYANNNPYKYVDPDGRAALITHKKDGSISIQVPMKFKGPGATPANISAIKNESAAAFSGSYEIEGKATKVDFQVVDVTATTPARVRNEVQLLNGLTSHEKGRSFVRGYGGTSGEINTLSRDISYGERPHEMGHFAGARDHYDYTTGKADPRYQGNLMGQFPGKADHRNIIEMLGNTKNMIQYEE